MTASKLEESIEKLAEGMVPLINAQSCGLRDYIRKSLRAFAEAVRAIPVDNTPQVKDWFCTVCGNKPACGCGKPPDDCCQHLKPCNCAWHCGHCPIEKLPEPNECTSQCHRGCEPCCSCGEPAALPDEVKKHIDNLEHVCMANGSERIRCTRDELIELATLCLSLRKP